MEENIKSRAEAYLLYAMGNKENYPKPVTREDYYLLSLAQEVRSGGADPATITTAVNDYLAANPVQAMTDEQIATSVNKSISDGTIEVMSEVEDGSITESKLNDDVFYNAYVTNGNYGTYPHLKYTIDYTGVTVSGPYTYKVTCKVTPLKDFTMDGMCGISANNAMAEKNSIKLKFELEQKNNFNDEESIGKVKVFIGDKDIYNTDVFVKEKQIQKKLNFFQKIGKWFKELW